MKLLLVFCCIYSVSSQAVLPSFKNPVKYTPMDPAKYDKTLNSTNPLGFTKALLPHPPNDDRPNPVISLEELNGKYIDFRIETVNNGDSICAKDDDTGPAMCNMGQVQECYAPSKENLNFEFYCADSCVSSDVWFYYRVVVSPEGADDQWCANQVEEFPSYLQEEPGTLPKRGKVTPAPPKKKYDNVAVGVIPTMLLICSAMLSIFVLF
ncbi:uncharacterized protein LOC130626197 [Hydractinia symbiolongicarpus]|uniref:uncharacterized protein LOC130626197 n=1 Tax=Hydractinia symbiolongicarpus TaxID=13093 RepID=UPI00254A3603|nr:uncharacterized protein LOC130626197 [Hydractinia symbiolongicarpus]